MSLYKRVLTQLAGKMGPALRVAYRDVGKEREQGCGSFAYRDVGKERKHGRGSFAYRDVGKQREHACMDAGSRATQGAVAEGCGSLDWRLFRDNSNILISDNRL